MDIAAYTGLCGASPRGGFSECIDVLKAVSQTTRTGKLLRAKPMTKHSQSAVTQVEIDTVAMLKGTHVMEASVAASKQQFWKSLAAQSLSTVTLPSPKNIFIYTQIAIKDVPCSSPMDLYNCNLETFLRG